MLIGIFGSGGYLGAQIVDLCKSLGLRYISLGRNIENHDSKLIDEISLLFDCGFPRNYYRKKVSVEYLKEIERRSLSFQRLGPNYFYLGTLTGKATKATDYSQLKGEAENLLKRFGATILCLGLVTSDDSPGGRYKELSDRLEKMPVALIPSSEWFPVMITDLNDFVGFVRDVLQGNEFQPKIPATLVPLRTIILKLSTRKMRFEVNAFICRMFSVLVHFLPLNRLEGIKAISVPFNYSNK